MKNKIAVSGALWGFLSVALGAFGAHALKNRLDVYQLGIYKTATEYMMTHALAILVCSIYSIRKAAYFFNAGIIVFSGTLIALAMTGVSWLGAITPLGGICFLIGWGLLAYHAATHLGSAQKV